MSARLSRFGRHMLLPSKADWEPEFEWLLRFYVAAFIASAAAVAMIASVGAPGVALVVACVFIWSLERTVKHYIKHRFPNDEDE